MSQNAFTVRNATLVDLPVILAIAAECTTAPAWSASVWRQVLESAGGIGDCRVVLLALVGEVVAGFAVLQKVSGEGELESLAVGLAFRRKRVATRLCEALFARARASGVDRVQLEVRAGNAAALALYAKLGFQMEGKRTRYYADPSEDALLLARAL